MVEGGGSKNYAQVKKLMYNNPKLARSLLSKLAKTVAEYLSAQIEAGADALQIFDSWAGVLDEASFEAYAIAPVKRIVDRVRAAIPDAKLIGFAKGAGPLLKTYREKTGVNAVGLDWQVPLSFAKELQAQGAVQGNLDPLRLIAGGKALEEGVDRILETLKDGPHIFNLGHGITPEAPIEHVDALLKRIRGL